MPLTEPEVRVLSTLVEEGETFWSEQRLLLPRVLYHYTSADGLIGILTSQSLWLTDLRYMNDLSELQYARGVVGDRLQRRAEMSDLSSLRKEFIKRATATFDPFKVGYSVFAACFCEAGNLLSQWRAYRGRGGGYAIGFDFFHTLRLLSRPCVMRKVIYDEDEQRRIIDTNIDAFLTVLAKEESARPVDEVTNTFLPELCRTFATVMGQCLFAFKHPDFREEREWRLVHFAHVEPVLNRGGDLPSVRNFEGNVIPYFTVSMEQAIRASRDDTLGVPFPIVELAIGPTINAELNQQSVRTLLLGLNPDIEPRIIPSAIPLRWL